MEGVSDEVKAEWRKNIEQRIQQNLSEEGPPQELSEEDLENLSGAFSASGPIYAGAPWSRIVDAAPEGWKEQWRKKLEDKYGKS